MSDSKASTTQASTNRAAARQQVLVGFGVISLSTSIFMAVMTNFAASDPQHSPEANTIADFPIPSSSGLSNEHLQTILSGISELKDLIKESTASLNDKVDGITCTFGRKQQEVNGPVLAAIMIGTLSVFILFIGLIILSDGLTKISVTLRNRAWACGLFGANAGLAYLVATGPSEKWISYLSWTLWPMFLSMLAGIISDRGTFLAE